MKAETLAIELLTEELPPKALKQLGEVFGKSLFGMKVFSSAYMRPKE